MAKFIIYTLGCKVNQVESDSLTAMLLESGHVPVQAGYDVAIINGCAVTQLAEKKSLQLIARIKKQAGAAKIILVGCAADKVRASQQPLLNCAAVIGNAEKHNLPKLLDMVLDGQAVCAEAVSGTDFPEYSFAKYPQLRTRAFIKIQDGCDNYCSYCIIPYLRGGVRSRPIKSELQEVNALIAAGFKEIVLTGIHLGNYGKESGFAIRLDELVVRILLETTIERIRLGSIESPELSDRLLNLLASEPRLCRHLHLPLQSGCDATLKRMNRNYQTADYRSLLENIRARLPDLAITADVIVGFPGETDAEFTATYEFIEQLPLAGLHVFPFSRRSGTAAWSMPDQITSDKKKQRAKLISELGGRLQRDFQTARLNQPVKVLFESIIGSFASGFSENYQKIYVPSVESINGEILTVRPLAIFRDGLSGELLCTDDFCCQKKRIVI